MLTNNSINTPALTTPGYLLIGTGTRPITGPIFGTNGIFVEFADDAIKISGSSILSGAPVDNYVAVGTGTSLTYVYVPTGQLLIGTGTRPVGAPLTAGTGIVITSSAGSITVATANSLGGTPIANYVAIGTGTSLTYVYIPTGQLLIGTGTSPIGAPLTAGTGIVITSSAGSITVATANSLGGTPIANYVAVGTGTSLTYVYVPTGQLLIGTGTRPVGARLIAGTNITITSSSGSITIGSSGGGNTGAINWAQSDLGAGTGHWAGLFLAVAMTWQYISNNQIAGAYRVRLAIILRNNNSSGGATGTIELQFTGTMPTPISSSNTVWGVVSGGVTSDGNFNSNAIQTLGGYVMIIGDGSEFVVWTTVPNASAGQVPVSNGNGMMANILFEYDTNIAPG